MSIISRSFFAGTSLFLLAFTLPSQAQYKYGAIASCSDFDCNGPDGCDVQGNSYFSAGMVPFETPFGPNLTWTMALRGEDHNTSNTYTTWIKDYYLGTPPGLDLQQDTVNGYIGCAAFFVDSNASFPLRQPPGTCNDVIGRDCMHALRNYGISSVNDRNTDAMDLCTKMENAFEEGLSPACSGMGLSNQTWGRIKFRPITGPNAPQPPSAAKNRSTNCHPVIPASYDLSPALSFRYSSRDDSLWNSTFRFPNGGAGSIGIDDFQNQQAVPILSVFTTEDGGDILADVKCLTPAVEGATEVTRDDSAAWQISPAWGLILCIGGFYALIEFLTL